MGGRVRRFRTGMEDINVLFCFRCVVDLLPYFFQLFLHPWAVAYYDHGGNQHKAKPHSGAPPRPSQKGPILISPGIL